MGLVPPQPGYLQGLRDLCDEHDTLLLFDEVMSGFRVHLGGAQALYGVTPDVTCLGKVIGGGLPCAAYGASEKVMHTGAPAGPMYQAGTLSGNPLAMAAGVATLTTLRDTDAYTQLENTTAELERGLLHAAARAGVPIQTARVGSMFGLFFAGHEVTNYEQAKASHHGRFFAFFREMLDHGIMLAPGMYEAWFTSTAHTHDTTAQTVDAAAHAFAAAARIE